MILVNETSFCFWSATPHINIIIVNMEVPMEQEGVSDQVVAGGSVGYVNVSLHPLVVMNVSDHFTRVKVQNDIPASNISGTTIIIIQWACTCMYNYVCIMYVFTYGILVINHSVCVLYTCYVLCLFASIISVYGVLLGQQKGRSVEICNSYELLVEKTEDGRLVCDKEYFLAKEDQCKYMNVLHGLQAAAMNSIYNFLLTFAFS